MPNVLVTALIAGFVSLLVSGIGFFSSWIALRAKSRELETQIRSKYMEKLYEMRLQHYPVGFELTRKLTRAPKLEKSFEREEMLSVRNELSNWINGPAGLIVSAEVIKSVGNLRDALNSNYGEGDKYARSQIEKMVTLANDVRRELRADVSFLHVSDYSRIRDVS